ncbi:MAG TPA: galactosyltransferase-related protein [Bosea sp. (in: a-proteobacteria)]|jgi:GT2 family glycosyltransferase|uniref:glycosyltransferase family 2 protein n=1 Tax=Bosea sp. (in: a-proteobacteria) TaxID=1871050 RepID=UPI002DDDB780|nr:galactosyltransferase-related protein [Bosea sp. (in: a-proteobacteria)]HEV2553385.1 galactosyltransferase-related protein [Bosea sp. (in: a-proteobacteria)]
MISVLTLVKNRREHLDNLVEGLRRSTVAPAKLVIVDMSDVPIAQPVARFPIEVVRLDTTGLPLAQARNLAAAKAATEALLFLDVDCIPGSNLVGAMAAAVRDPSALICAEIRYLAAADTRGGVWTEASLKAVGVPHPVRSFPADGLVRQANAGLFWSLAFGVNRAAFERTGGFDERFTGYGAEDTDFAFRATAAELELFFMGGTSAFHQHHAVYDPPLQHFADIVRNARLFRDKWGFWPMDGWLDAFARMGFLRRSQAELTVIKSPSGKDIADAIQSADRRF